MISPRTTSLIVAILIVFGLGIFATYCYLQNKTVLPTYFNYQTASTATLKGLSSTKEINVNELKYWNDITFNLIRENKLGDKDTARILAYLYTAQRDAAFLSYNNQHKFAGSISPVTIKVLCRFFPNNCKSLDKKYDGDKYSDQLATIVFAKINERLTADEKGTRLYPEKMGDQHWRGEKPYFGQDAGSWKTWFLKSSDEFRAPAPPAPGDQEWQNQLQQTKSALNKITPAQTKAVVFWAGGPGTITPPGQWLTLANDYMLQHNSPLEKILLVRSVLAMGITDAVIAVYDSKYTYWIKRPFMQDKTIQTIMPTPNHPSYPAGHATISAAAATILVYYFPQEKNYWLANAEEASNSRVWGGIHFPIDNQQGYLLGEKVANTVIKAQHAMAK